MNSNNQLRKGDKVADQYGYTFIVLAVVGNSVKVYGKPNDYYHVTKLVKLS